MEEHTIRTRQRIRNFLQCRAHRERGTFEQNYCINPSGDKRRFYSVRLVLHCGWWMLSSCTNCLFTVQSRQYIFSTALQVGVKTPAPSAVPGYKKLVWITGVCVQVIKPEHFLRLHHLEVGRIGRTAPRITSQLVLPFSWPLISRMPSWRQRSAAPRRGRAGWNLNSRFSLLILIACVSSSEAPYRYYDISRGNIFLCGFYGPQ